MLLLAASAFATAPVLARGERIAIAAALDGCVVNVVATVRGRRKLTIREDDVLAEGRGTVEWSGPLPDGRGSSARPITYTAVVGKRYAQATIDLPDPVLGELMVGDAPLTGMVKGYADIPPVVTFTVTHPCPDLVSFRVSGLGIHTEVRPVDGVVRIPLGEGFGPVTIETYFSGYELAEKRRFEYRVEAARACLDDDGDGLSDCDGDCDDGEPRVRAGFPEVVWDGIDNDCDGTHLGDADGDGWDAARHVPRIDAAGMHTLEALYGPVRARRVAREMMEPDLFLSGADLFDCDDTDPAVGRPVDPDPFDTRCAIAEPGPGDDDGDGYANECADDDATRHPGAPEVANGFDDDCDGRIDEGVAPVDTPETTVKAPEWLGLLDLPSSHTFVLGGMDVDAVAFALRPPVDRHAIPAEHWIEVDSGGGSWHGTLYGAPAENVAKGLESLGDAYGNRGQVALWRMDGGIRVTSEGTSFMYLTSRLLGALPMAAALPIGVFLVPAAALHDGARMFEHDTPAEPGAPVANPLSAPLPEGTYVYLLVITRDSGPGGLTEVRVREKP